MVDQPKGVGDISSSELGSGARYNAGKPDFSLIPLSILAEHFKTLGLEVKYYAAMHSLAKFQIEQQDAEYLNDAIRLIGNEWKACANVFTYGKKKYAAWNWAKGMAWSVCIACIGRHFERLAMGELMDPESGEPHIGHVMCNIVMLAHYVRFYPEGNDLYQQPAKKPDAVLIAKRLATSIADENTRSKL